MPMMIIDPMDIPPQPWRNGKGTTRELWAEPDGPDPRWRLSLADLTDDGPFSYFDGFDRIFTPISHGGFELVVAGRPHRAEPNQPIHFAGEADTRVRELTEPARALNLMTSRNRCSGTVQIRRHDGDTSWRTDVSALMLIAGTLTVQDIVLPPLGVVISTAATSGTGGTAAAEAALKVDLAELTGVANDALIAEIRVSGRYTT